jgi:predicted transcriptional regulator
VVHQLLGGKDKYNTIMTVMLRLANKKALARERVGLQYQYWLLSQSQKAPSFFEGIKRKIFGVRPVELFSYLIDSESDLSDEELLEMEKILEKAKQKRNR